MGMINNKFVVTFRIEELINLLLPAPVKPVRTVEEMLIENKFDTIEHKVTIETAKLRLKLLEEAGLLTYNSISCLKDYSKLSQPYNFTEEDYNGEN
jgi:hypothetical protein